MYYRRLLHGYTNIIFAENKLVRVTNDFLEALGRQFFEYKTQFIQGNFIHKTFQRETPYQEIKLSIKE